MIVYNLSETAREGLALLKYGAVALKHGRSGKPHRTQFTLSPDEAILSWTPVKISFAKSVGRRMSATAEPKRVIAMDNVVELLIGRESAVFQRRANDTGQEHLSLTLKLVASLPAPPSPDDGGGGEASPTSARDRETLDLSFDSEEHFGQ